jgi:protein-disulfide isomerase
MRHKSMAWAVTAGLGLLLAQVGAAQSPDEARALAKDVQALKAGQAAMQKDLDDIKALLQGAQPPQAPAAPAGRAPAIEQADLLLSLAGAPVVGEANAKVTLVEFTDYQCPFCSRHFRQTWPQIEQDYVKTGKVKLVVRDFPLEQIHPQALKAAEAVRCAGDQGKFWEMHDRLFLNQPTLARKDLSGHAEAVGLDVKEFDKCVDSGKQATKVRTDAIDATRATARGTPIFFLGLTDPNTLSLKAVRVIRGAQPFAVFKEAIDGLLASAN